jgi:hypothetical protein
VDESIPTDRLTPRRKPWLVALTQETDAISEIGGVDGLPAGTTVLLSEHEVLELARYLVEPQTAAWSSNPTPVAGDTCEVRVFLEPGMVAVTESGAVVNGEEHWTPDYFAQAEPLSPPRISTRKIHTLPWPMEVGPAHLPAIGTGTDSRSRKVRSGRRGGHQMWRTYRQHAEERN